jgi:hypothetical protein
MLKALSMGILLLVASASAAAADNMCGDEPIAPAVPSPADIRQKPPADAASAKHNAFQEILRWQRELKSYRACLEATVSTDKRKLGEAARSDKPDKDKLAKIQQDISDANHATDSSTDDEERVVNDFNALSTAYCTRTDVDKTSCPK